jgi:2-polyprenyl-6-methoxyphenol hydroxylase-like FAD-dependent oxidoreductase
VAERLAAIADSFGDAARVAEALQSYEQERIPETSKVVKEAGFVGKFVHFENPLACKFRDLVFYKATPKFVWRKRARAYLVAGT